MDSLTVVVVVVVVVVVAAVAVVLVRRRRASRASTASMGLPDLGSVFPPADGPASAPHDRDGAGSSPEDPSR